MIVGLDVDDVVADLIPEWLKRYNNRTGDNVLAEDIDGWGIHKFCPKMSEQAFYGILHEPDLYESVVPHVGAHAMVCSILADGHRIVYISSCVGNTAGDKKEWLVRWGFLSGKNKHKDFIAAHDKSLVSGVDVLFDDRPLNVEEFPHNAYLVNRPHNRNTRGLRRVNLGDIPRIVRGHASSNPGMCLL